MYDKEKLFRYRRVSKVNLYRINEFEDYYYGYMVPSTGYLKYYDLHLYGDGFVLQLPVKENEKVVPPFQPQHILYKEMKETCKWQTRLGVSTVGDLNDKITKGEMNELILVQEALMEKRIGQIAEHIASKPEKRIVLIAGPSFFRKNYIFPSIVHSITSTWTKTTSQLQLMIILLTESIVQKMNLGIMILKI